MGLTNEATKTVYMIGHHFPPETQTVSNNMTEFEDKSGFAKEKS